MSLHVIKLIEDEIRLGHKRIQALREACEHDWQPHTPEHPDASTPKCTKCGDNKSGWWCEASPTKECDYERPDGRGYNPDSCRYCHQPDERK